jgi:hypothetical protein
MQLKIAASRSRKIEHVRFVEMTQAQHKRSTDAIENGLASVRVEKTQPRRSTDAA